MWRANGNAHRGGAVGRLSSGPIVNAFGDSDYLRLDELLGAVHPSTAADDRSSWANERYFMVSHQLSELWVSQILVDLELALEFARVGDFDKAVACVARANAVLGLAITTLTALVHLAVHDV